MKKEHPLGVTVKEKGTNVGTATDVKGDFTLVVSEDAKLEVTRHCIKCKS